MWFLRSVRNGLGHEGIPVFTGPFLAVDAPMRKAIFILALAGALPLAAQSRFELILDAEGVHRNADAPSVPDEAGLTYQPSFENGGGIGGGVNWWMSGRTSLEVKVAGLASKTRVVLVGEDYVYQADLGWSQVYPITAVAQWHPVEHGSFRPYIGAGVAYVILRNIGKTDTTPEEVFGNPWGFVLNAGLRVPLSKRWSLMGDAKYIPVETSGTVRFGTSTQVDLEVKPLVVGVGVVYHF
jgi:outer membrane protein W